MTESMTARYATAARTLSDTDPARLSRILELARRLATHPDDEADAIARAVVAVATAPGLTTEAVVRKAVRSAYLDRVGEAAVIVPVDPTDADDLAEIRATDDRATDAAREAVTYEAALAAIPSTSRAILRAITADAIARHTGHLDAMTDAGATDPAPWCEPACQNITGRAVIIRAKLRPSVVAVAVGKTGRLGAADWAAVRASAAMAASELFARIAGQTDPARIRARAHRAALYSASTTGGGTALLSAHGGQTGNGVAFMGGGKASKASPRGERLAPVFPWTTYASPVVAASVTDVARMLSALSALMPDADWDHFRTVVSVTAPARDMSAGPLARGGFVPADAGQNGQNGENG